MRLFFIPTSPCSKLTRCPIQAHLAHTQLLHTYRHPTRARRRQFSTANLYKMPHTYTPTFDLSTQFPQLPKKLAVFLHPRKLTLALSPQSSKMGGHFYWPRNEPWPTSPINGHSMVAVLQLHSDDVPELGFPAGKNLFQLLWCPEEDHEEADQVFYPFCTWRYVAEHDSTQLLPLDEVPPPVDGTYGFSIPKPCALHPERVEEYPSFDEAVLISSNLPEQVENWIADNAQHDLNQLGITGDDNSYQYCWGAAPNTKVGGWIAWSNAYDTCECNECGVEMDHLLSISSSDYGGNSTRWFPTDESRQQARDGHDLCIGDGAVYALFICRKCEHWPIKSLMA